MRPWLVVVCALFPALLPAQTGRGPYARIAILRPHDGKSVEFEAGYVRHLEWHKEVRDPWAWYGWSIWAGERYRWFVYATFGHSATSLDSAVSPAADELDNLRNVAPHVEWVENGLYEFLPELSRGGAEPEPSARLEFTSVELRPGTSRAFEAALAASRPALQDEALWYRMVVGGAGPRYVRLRPQPGLWAVLSRADGQELPDKARSQVARLTVEVWTLRPAMSMGLPPPTPH